MNFIIDPRNIRHQEVHRRTVDCVDTLDLSRPWKVSVEPYEAPRTLEQNDKMWAMLQDVSEQVPWVIDGKPAHPSKEEWKDIFTAALKREQRVTQGIDGGFVILGARTSKMSKRAMSDLIELITAFGAQHDVAWSNEPQQEAA